jgi:hypothetical protein
VQQLYHDPLELLTRAMQPVLFGEVMARVRGVAPGNIPYLDFLAGWVERAQHTNAVLELFVPLSFPKIPSGLDSHRGAESSHHRER